MPAAPLRRTLRYKVWLLNRPSRPRSQEASDVIVNKWLRRIRGAIGIGLAWAAAWFAAGMALLLVVGVGAADVPFPLFFGLLGFLSGVTFSVVLGLTEGRRRFDQMSIPRFALWGALGAVALSGALIVVAGLEGAAFGLLGPVFAVSGAGCAAGSLVLARMTEDRELLAESSEVADVGLTRDEARDLLGGG